MYTIKTPATSANLGPGFDCLGLALNLYNSFDVELSSIDTLDNVEERFNNRDNLFLQAWHKGCEAIHSNDHVHAVFHCSIPVSRGLGSSASMIVGGLTAASVLHDDALEDSAIFELAAEMEGHPDNAAPCVFGGLTACLNKENAFLAHSLELNSIWQFTLFIPDFEVSTEEARKILPEMYSRHDASCTGADAVIMCDALRIGDMRLLKAGAVDYIHEPYRKKLIPGFDDLKKAAEKDTGGAMLISGSGSTCILISRSSLSRNGKESIEKLPGCWKIIPAEAAVHGTEIRGN
jgi:homoserine kinase